MVVTGDLTPRGNRWAIHIVFSKYIVKEIIRGLAAVTASETDTGMKGKIQTAHIITAISWCTYPGAYIFPMLGIEAASAVASIQIGYCASDIVSKGGVGVLIYQITYARVQQGRPLG